MLVPRSVATWLLVVFIYFGAFSRQRDVVVRRI